MPNFFSAFFAMSLDTYARHFSKKFNLRHIPLEREFPLSFSPVPTYARGGARGFSFVLLVILACSHLAPDRPPARFFVSTAPPRPKYRTCP